MSEAHCTRCKNQTVLLTYTRFIRVDRARATPVYGPPEYLCYPCYKEAVRDEISGLKGGDTEGLAARNPVKMPAPGRVSPS